MSVNAAQGIDLGSSKCVMGVVKKGGIDIVLNDATGRSTPVCAAYLNDQERLIGTPAVQQAKRNMKNTILFPTRFLGLNGTCTQQLELENRFVSHKVVSLESNKLAFEVSNMGQQHQFNIEQIIAFYLMKIKHFYERSEYQSKDITISIPSYASNVERQALLDAAEIAGLKCLRIINESTAIVLNYGFFRKKDLDEKKERVVAFVDFGHSKTTITIASFKKGEAKILVHHSDRNLGARDFDYEVMQVIGGEFAKKYGDDPRKIAKCRLRMYDVIEKARKQLSGDTESSINVEFLLNDEDLNRKMNREEFQQIIDPLVRRFSNLVLETFEKAQISPDNIEFVELVGDATRTPILIDQIKMLFKKQELQRTLNSLEVVARGAALNCAMLTPNFSVQPFKLNDYNSLPVSISYNFKDANQDKQYPGFFKVGQKFPMSQELTWDGKEGDMTLAINYAADSNTGVSPLLPGLPDTVAQYTVGKAKKTKADVDGGSKSKLTVRVRNNIHQIPELESVVMTESWSEIEKIPIKVAKPAAPAKKPEKKEEKKEEAKAEEAKDGEAPAADGAEAKPDAGEAKAAEPAPEEPKAPEPVAEQQYEEKVRQRSREYGVSFSTVSHAIPPDQRKQYAKQEAELYAADRAILDVKEAKNDLEAYAYDMKGNLEPYGNYEHYIDPTLKESYVQNLQATVDWIYGEGESAVLKEYQERYSALKAVGDPVKNRWRFRSQIDEWVALFQKVKTQKIEPKLAEAQAGGPQKLTEEQQKQIVDKVQVVDEYFVAINTALEQPKDKDLPYTLDQVEAKIEALKAEVEAILTAPPPKPKEEKKEEPKDGAAEEKKADDAAGDGQPADADAEMKDEGQPAANGESTEPADQPAAATEPPTNPDVEMEAGADGAGSQAQQ